MSDEGGMQYRFNIIKHRGDPKTATTQSGHKVEKKDRVYIKSPEGAWISLKCADYHNEHFVYIDPVYNMDGPESRGHWFALCTCGSHAVIIGPGQSRATHESATYENMLVCAAYMTTLLELGVGYHSGQERRPWR